MSQNPKINLLKKRDFGDLLQDSIQFVVQNSRVIIRALVMYVGPLFLLSAIINAIYFRESGFANLNLEALMKDPMEALMKLGENSPNWSIVSISYLLSMAVFVVMAAAINSILVQYNRSATGEVLMEKIWEDVKAYSLPYTGLTLLNFLVFFGVYFVGIMIVVGVAAVINSPVVAVLVVLPLAAIFYMIAVLPLTYIIRMNEDISATQTLSRAFQLVKGHFWQTFGLLFLLLVIMNVLIFGLYGMAGVFSLIFGEKLISLGGMLVIGGLIGSLVSSLLSSVVFAAIGLQYFNLQEDRENTFDSSRIDEIGADFGDEESQA